MECLLKLRPLRLALCRLSSSASSGTPPPSTVKPPPAKPVPVSASTTDPSKYNVPEYYQHEKYSYYDIDSTIFKHRITQPSKYDPLVPKK